MRCGRFRNKSCIRRMQASYVVLEVGGWRHELLMVFRLRHPHDLRTAQRGRRSARTSKTAGLSCQGKKLTSQKKKVAAAKIDLEKIVPPFALDSYFLRRPFRN